MKSAGETKNVSFVRFKEEFHNKGAWNPLRHRIIRESVLFQSLYLYLSLHPYPSLQ
jgi:hypothetical protein